MGVLLIRRYDLGGEMLKVTQYPQVAELLTPHFNVSIEGYSLVLEPISVREINERYLSWLNNPQINQFLEVRAKKQTIEDIYQFINQLRSKKGCECFAVFTKESKLHIGNIAVSRNNPNDQAVAYYGILIGDQNASMLGLGAEASILILEFLFNTQNVRRVHGGALALNKKSWQLLEKLGFKREGTLRKAVVLSSGHIDDSYLYAILKEEWLKERSQFAFILDQYRVVKKNGNQNE